MFTRSACAVLYASALTLHAQSNVIEPLKTTVTVTGTRTATELESAPVSTSLVTRRELEARGVNQIDQVLSVTEGVNAYRTKGPADNDFGAGMRGFSGRGKQARTLVLLDGQPLNDSYNGSVNWAMLPVDEFERVEVVRGPFSSLYGGNAMAGVINLITRPVDRRSLEISAQRGGQSTTTYSIRGADRFFGRLGLSLGYQRYQSNGYATQPALKAASTPGAAATEVTGVQPWLTPGGGSTYQIGMRGEEWFNQEGWRGRAEYSFSRNIFASLQYFHQGRGSGNDRFTTSLRDPAGREVSSGPVRFTDASGATRGLSISPADYLGTPGGSAVRIYQAQLLTTPTPHWNLRLMGGWNRIPSEWYITPGSAATLLAGPGNFTDQATRALYGGLQAGWNFRRRHQFVFGADRRHDQAAITVHSIPNYTSRDNPGALQSQAGGKSVNQSVFAQDQFNLGERLTLVAGGRYDYWSTSRGRSQRNASSGLLLHPMHAAHSVTAKVAASWQAPAGLRLRGSVGNAFRNPTIYELYRDLSIGSTLYLANPDAGPEHLLSFETGVQRRFGAVSLDAAYYENRVYDLLYRTTDFAADPAGRALRLTNAGLAHTRGAELSARQQLATWLELRQNYTYTGATITENASLPATVGKRVPFVPAHMASFSALIDGRRPYAALTGRYQGAVFSTDVNTDVVRGVPGSYNPFFTADISGGFRVNRLLTVTASVFNLLDRRCYLGPNLMAGRQAFVGLRIRL